MAASGRLAHAEDSCLGIPQLLVEALPDLGCHCDVAAYRRLVWRP